jgi:hypothetical protein
VASESLAVSSPPGRRTVGGYVWFALMIGGWSLFLVLVFFSESMLGKLWRDLHDLPLVVEGLLWLLLFPLVLIAATRPREHRVFAGRLDKSKLSFPERAVVLAFRAVEGDFRDWDAIAAWSSEIAAALEAGAARGE